MSIAALAESRMRYRQLQADFHGHVAELLAKSTQQNALDQAVSKEDREILMQALQILGRAGRQLRIQEGRRQLDAARL